MFMNDFKRQKVIFSDKTEKKNVQFNFQNGIQRLKILLSYIILLKTDHFAKNRSFY